jgi:hypothetical protein
MLERTTYLIEFFKTHPCVDCGETDPVVLEFDHLRDKSFAIGPALSRNSWQSILDETKKCEVVCANCHRRRTAQRRGALRAVLTRLKRSSEAGGGNRTRDGSLEGSCVTNYTTPAPGADYRCR